MGVHENTFDSTLGAYLLLLPTLVAIVAFLYYPSLQTLRFSFFQTFLFGQNTRFVGLANFTELLSSQVYLTSVGLTIAFAAIVVVGSLAVGLAVAFLLYEVSDGKAAYLIAAIWPYALPTAVAGTVLLFLAHPSVGIYTHYIEAWFGVKLDWFTVGWQGFAVVAVAAIWKQIGYNVIFMLAALNNVPESLNEACELDGIETWRRLVRVYVPLMSPTLVFLVVINTIYAFFGSFALIDLMTQGGPTNATNLMIYQLYRDAFQFNNLGLASAQSVILFVLVAGLTFVQLRVSDRYAHY
ncbi:carbohydrate ABC transporter permease [Halorubrum sp. N11]|uniref:carbohydrate ABC transporter permease n=1 Tax=Halorubrum sp. N11 TaxID=3402276 RepID=UPI003EBBE98E